MPRRVRLPGASELFRPTAADAPERDAGGQPVGPAPQLDVSAVPVAPVNGRVADRRRRGDGPAAGGSGRVRHEEKITVYVSREELLTLERARLRLRGELGLAVDRGRLVRAAVALALADLEAAGESGELVRRLTAP